MQSTLARQGRGEAVIGPTADIVVDPLWGTDDPAAGDWFPQQALQLAQLATPALHRT